VKDKRFAKVATNIRKEILVRHIISSKIFLTNTTVVSNRDMRNYDRGIVARWYV